MISCLGLSLEIKRIININPYSPLECIINTSLFQFVGVSFLSLDVEQEQTCAYDSISFYDGADTSNMVASICGNVAPAYFTSSGNQLLIEFRTDSSVTADGFLLEVSSATEYRYDKNIWLSM